MLEHEGVRFAFGPVRVEISFEKNVCVGVQIEARYGRELDSFNEFLKTFAVNPCENPPGGKSSAPQ